MPVRVTASDIAALEKSNKTFKEKAHVAREVVAALPAYQGEAFRRYWAPYFGPGLGYTEEEIADEMEMPVTQVHSLIHQTFEAIGEEWRRRKGITESQGRLLPLDVLSEDALVTQRVDDGPVLFEC